MISTMMYPMSFSSRVSTRYSPKEVVLFGSKKVREKKDTFTPGEGARFTLPPDSVPALVRVKDGVFHLDNKPVFVHSADYPYYRDSQDDWSRQLDNIKQMNVPVITCYIPWRHHAVSSPVNGKQVFDFKGKTKANRNVVEFIRLCKEKGLKVIVKPGPFVHSELDDGGLPSYASAGEKNGIQAQTNLYGNPNTWGSGSGTIHLPAPLDPKYKAYVKEWITAVNKQVIQPFLGEDGPIIGVQVLNEGIYSDARWPVVNYDFSSSSVRNYQDFLKRTYGKIDRYNNRNQTGFSNWSNINPPRSWSDVKTLKDIRRYLDWAQYSGDYYGRVIKTVTDPMKKVNVPSIINVSLADLDFMDSYVSRFDKFAIGDKVGYGYTSWVGVVQRDEVAYRRHQIAARQGRGICMEENWGYGDIYDTAYNFTAPSYFETMLYLALGATGMNLYTGVTVDNWTKDIDTAFKDPMPTAAPINYDGAYRDKFWTAHQLGSFLKNEGSHLVSAKPEEPMAWGLYMPYAYAAAWQRKTDEWRKLGFVDRPRAVTGGWSTFLAQLDKKSTPGGMVNLQKQSPAELAKHRMIFLAGSRWMDRPTQKKLIQYVEGGGTLVMSSEVPTLDENFQSCTLLKDRLFPSKETVLPLKYETKIKVAGAYDARAHEFVQSISLPRGAKSIAKATVDGKPVDCGYVLSQGKGKAVYLGFNPYNESGSEKSGLTIYNTGLEEALGQTLQVGPLASLAEERPGSNKLTLSQLNNAEKGIQYIFALTREQDSKNYRLRYTDEGGKTHPMQIQMAACSAATVGIEKGRLRSAIVKGINDLDKKAIEPRLSVGKQVFCADKPCDIAFSKGDTGYTVQVTNVPGKIARITFPVPMSRVKEIVQVGSDGVKRSVPFNAVGTNIVFQAIDSRYWDESQDQPVHPTWTQGYEIVLKG